MRALLSIFAGLLTAQVFAAEPLFDRVVAKGKGFEIKSSQVADTFTLFKANRAAIGAPVPNSPEDIKKTEAEILDSLISAKLLLARATEADRTNGVAEAEKFIQQKKAAAPNEAAFKRQLIISGVTPELFEKEVREQAIIKAVVDRELRSKQTVTDADVEKFYKDNPDRFTESEKWKVAHIYMANRDRATREELPESAKAAKKSKLAVVLAQARGGADFAKLVKENSEHDLTRDKGGEQTFTKGQMPPQFEAAVSTMKPGQISDIVETGLGWHIIKFLEKIPPKIRDFEASKQQIKDFLLQEATQKALPAYVKQLRQEAGVEVTL